MNSSCPSMFNMVRPCALIMILLFAGVTTGFAEVFTWSPQCPDPTWFGVCEGEICDVENNTPLSLNNWGRSACGELSFPSSQSDEAVVLEGNLPALPLSLRSLTIGPNASATQVIPGAALILGSMNNEGVFNLNGTLSTGAAAAVFPAIFNKGLIESEGLSFIRDVTNSGELRVRSGQTIMLGVLESDGGSVNVHANATLSFQNSHIGGELSGVIDGQAIIGADESTDNQQIILTGTEARFDFSGNGIELRGARLEALDGTSIVNSPAGKFIRSFPRSIYGHFINEGLFIEDFPFSFAGGNAETFTNLGEYEIRRFPVTRALFVNHGLISKLTQDDAELLGAIEQRDGQIRVEEGLLTVEGRYHQTGGEIVVEEGASLSLRIDASGVISGVNDGQLSFDGPCRVEPGNLTLNIAGHPINLTSGFFSTSQLGPRSVSIGVETTVTVDPLGNSTLVQADFRNYGSVIHRRGDFSIAGRVSNQISNFGKWVIEGADGEVTRINSFFSKNHGVITKTTSNIATINSFMNNTGGVEVCNGVLEFRYPPTATPSGRFDVSDSGVLNISTRTAPFFNTNLNGQYWGRIEGTATLGRVPAAGETAVGVDGITMQFTGNGINWQNVNLVPLNAPSGDETCINLSGGIIHIDDTGGLDGVPDLGYEIPIINDGVMTMRGNTLVNSSASFTNNGLIQVDNNRLYWGDSQTAEALNNNGVMEIDVATIAIIDDVLVNKGIIRLLGGRTIFTPSDRQQGSDLKLRGGRLEVYTGARAARDPVDFFSHPFVLEGGTIAGSGRVQHSITVIGGVIAPGIPVGTLNVSGSVSFQPANENAGFAIDLAGNPENDVVDQLVVGSTFGAGAEEPVSYGTLRVAAVDGFVPQIGMTYEIVSAGYVADGAFDRLVLVNFPDGLTVETSRTETSLSITIIAGDSQQLLGDMNCDGAVDTDDIIGLATALIDRDAYAFEIPICDANRADMNGDGALNGVDIPLFMQLLFE